MVRTAQGWNSGTSEGKLPISGVVQAEPWRPPVRKVMGWRWGEGPGFRRWIARGASLWYPFQTWVSGFLQPGVFLVPSFPPLAPLPFLLVNFLSDSFHFSTHSAVSWSHPIPPKYGFQNSMHVSFSKKTYLNTSPFKNTECRNKVKGRQYSATQKTVVFLSEAFAFNQACLSPRHWSALHVSIWSSLHYTAPSNSICA